MLQEAKDKDGLAGDIALKPSLIVVSAVRFLRESLQELLARDGRLQVLGWACALDDASALCRTTRPDLVLLDAGFPGGLSAVPVLRQSAPAARVVAFAVSETAENVVDWAQAGAAGYIPASAALNGLVSMLLDISQGRQSCSGDVAAALLSRLVATGAPSGATLTARERQIVGLIAAGMCNKDIARQLDIGLATTKSHVHNVLGKLNIRRRGQAAGRMQGHAS